MGFMASGGEIQVSENTSPWMDRKSSSFPSLTITKNTNWETASVHMSMAKEDIRKATGRFYTPVECWGCTNSLGYHADRFHTYRKWPNKRDADVAEREKQSIQKYAQRTSMMGGSRSNQDIQGQCGQIFPMVVHSMFVERRVQLTQSWK